MTLKVDELEKAKIKMAQNILKAAKPKIRCRLGFVFLAGSHAAHLPPVGLLCEDSECCR